MSLSIQDTILGEIAFALGNTISAVDLNSSFIENRGNSLSSIQLQAGFRRLGVGVSLDFIFTSKTVALLVTHVAQQYSALYIGPNAENFHGRKRRHSLVARTSGKKRRELSHVPSAISLPGNMRSNIRYPMTGMQLAFVHSSKNRPGRNIIHYHETHHTENIPALKQAWKAVIDVEPIFRTSLELNEDGGYLVENHHAHFKWAEVLVQDSENYYQELMKKDLDNNFLGTDFKVVTLPSDLIREGKSTLIWRVHHALIDAYSCSLVLSKVQRVLAGEVVSPGPSFAHFAKDLYALQERSIEAEKSYWEKQHDKHPSPVSELLLPPSFTCLDEENSGLGEVVFDIDAGKLSNYSKHTGIIPTVMFHATWALVMSRYGDSNEVCFGTVLSGRSVAIDGVENVVGPTISTLPLIVKLNLESTAEDYLREIFARLLELTSLQSTSSNRRFTTGFRTAMSTQFDIPASTSSTLSPIEAPVTRVMSDIPLQLEVENSGRIHLNYHSDAYSEFQIKRLAEIFSTTINLLQHPLLTIRSLLEKMVYSTNWRDLGRLGNWYSPATRVESVQDDLVTLFSRAALDNPSTAAIQLKGAFLTYRELHIQSSTVSRRISKWISPGDVVCVHADRSINWIVAIYAVLKAGAIYCPFDESLPAGIRDVNFETAEAKLFLASNEAAKVSRPASAEICYSIEELISLAEINPEDDNLEPPSPKPNTDAYLCFTSGSTGKPKGVLCKHQGLVAFQKDLEVRLQARPGWRIAQFMSPAFDGSIHEIFSALSYGATLVLQDRLSPFGHLKAADAAILTPSMALSLEPSDFENLRAVYLVGEAIPQSVCDVWAPNRKLYNMYGPTEATCGATIKKLSAGHNVTLGVPNPSTRVYILNSKQELVPWGVIGEIYLAGIQVASKYIGRLEETSKRFLPDPFNPQFRQRMYRTGDRGYLSDEGDFVFVGRKDRQIKLRGFRLDLDDLEVRMLQAVPSCSAVAIALKDDYLVAQVQPPDINIAIFRAQIRKRVPAYALPRHIIAVETFPTTPTGKLDYKAIVAQIYTLSDGASEGSRLFFSSSEQMVTSALRDTLNIPLDACIDLESSFIDLGGDSLQQLFLSHQLSKSFKRQIPIRLIIESPTLRSLATTLGSLEDTEELVINHSLSEDGISPIEREWWDKYQHQGGSSAFNVPCVCDIGEEVDKSKLRQAWDAVLARHRILSSRYNSSSPLKVSRSYAKAPPAVIEVQEVDIQRQIDTPFDLQKDDLIRVLISPKHLVVVVSHIICDLATLNTLLEEVTILYNGRILPPIKKSYSQTQWEVSAASCNTSFWEAYLENKTKSTSFSIGRNSIARKTWNGSSSRCEIPMKMYRQMIQFTATQKLTMHQLALAAVALALQHDNDSSDIILGAPYLNRHSEEDQNVVGLFLEPLPIRVRYPQPTDGNIAAHLQPDPKDSFVQAVRRTSQAALSHAIPWNQLLTYLNVATSFPDHPLFDAMVSFHHVDQAPHLDIDGLHHVCTETIGAKFKLMAEFTVSRDNVCTLRLEYSNEIFSEEDIELIRGLVFTALNGLVDGLNYIDVTSQLRSVSIEKNRRSGQ